MKKSIWAKLFGWTQFGLTGLMQVSQAAQSNGAPHGWAQWVQLIASFATATAIHASANTDGTK